MIRHRLGDIRLLIGEPPLAVTTLRERPVDERERSNPTSMSQLIARRKGIESRVCRLKLLNEWRNAATIPDHSLFVFTPGGLGETNNRPLVPSGLFPNHAASTTTRFSHMF